MISSSDSDREHASVITGRIGYGIEPLAMTPKDPIALLWSTGKDRNSVGGSHVQIADPDISVCVHMQLVRSVEIYRWVYQLDRSQTHSYKILE
jgi:hypothetical protein